MSYQSPPTIPTSPPIKSHSAIVYWNLPAIMIAHFRSHTSSLCPTSISTCKINVLNSFWMGGKEISWGRCKCKWKPHCFNALELQTLLRTNISHIFILYTFEMLKICHFSSSCNNNNQIGFFLFSFPFPLEKSTQARWGAPWDWVLEVLWGHESEGWRSVQQWYLWGL